MKFNKIFRILAAVLLPALLVVPIPATPALAVGETIILTNSQGAIGQLITISGSGFANATISRGVNILFGRLPISGNTMYTANIYEKVMVAELTSVGTFQTTFSVPARLNGGTNKEDVARGS